MRRTAHGATARADRGAAIVEFALVFPVFMMLVLGIFTGGLAYNRKLAMTNGAREAARFGATLPVAPAGMTAWLDEVAAVAVASAEGEMDADATDRSVCVSYVFPGGSATNDRTTTRREVGSTVSYDNTPCYDDDDQPDTVRRVQVVLGRTAELQALFFTRDLNLESRSVVRFEQVET